MKSQKFVFVISILCLLLFFLLGYFGHSKESLIVLYVFLITWGLEKCLSWQLGYKIGIGPMVAIPAKADNKLRVLGLIWGLFVASVGVFNLFQALAT